MSTADRPPCWYYLARHSPALHHRMDIVVLLAKTSRNGAERGSDAPGSTCAQGINFCSGPFSCRFCAYLVCERSLKTRQEITHDHPGDAVDDRIRGRSKRQNPGIATGFNGPPYRCLLRLGGRRVAQNRRPPRRVIGDAEKCLNLRNSGKS